MTQGLLIVTFFFVVMPLICIIITRFYACHTLQKLYDELSMAEIDAAFGMKRTYVDKYIQVLAFRNSFYVFLSNYLKKDVFSCHHFFCKSILPDFCKEMDSLYSR